MPAHAYAVLQLSIHLPGTGPRCEDCTVLSVQRAMPARFVLENTTENYNTLVRELGDAVNNLRHAVRTQR